jgi:hypothetical protein
MQASSNPLHQASGSLRPFLVRSEHSRPRYFDDQPPLPVLPSTLLQLDLLAGQRPLDLHAITDVLLEDVGAVLQLLREVSARPLNHGRRPTRIMDCVVLLGHKQLQRALFRGGVATRDTGVVVKLWRRSRLTAEISRILALRHREIEPADAYLAGLLHEIGRIPAKLSWNVENIDRDDYPAVEECLVREWSIPWFVAPTLHSFAGSFPSGSRLQQLVTVAWGISKAISSRKGLQPQGRSRRSSDQVAGMPSAPVASELRPIDISSSIRRGKLTSIRTLT